MRLVLLTMCLTITACGGPDASEAEAEADQETVFDPLVDSHNKAQEVEQVVIDQKRDLDAAIEQQEQGNSSDKDD